MKKKKIPLRICVSCGEKKPKKELVRIVKSKEGEIEIDFTGKKAGRGAYLCLKKECIKLARKEGKLNRALKIDVPAKIFEELENLLTTGGEINGENKGI